ncbi:uncharacterized protein LOC130808727 [Amaranthus tricolor]|uniref:uncharacterized protein LOC130808727 n=1 Tax=Amaranthus tricolor TaxID=29722 RepID=UPI0025884E37|nr:uncharacterized protein LOC130808727 [Amaranthus tricolor]XP_057530182.1 uncharacterized protein LOC130808727 [Amaranthus tricolor]
MSSNSSSPCSKKSKVKGRQPDLRELLFKRMKSQQTSNEGNESSRLSSPLSPPLSSPPSEDVNMEVGGSSSCDEPLDDEWVYDVELLPHDPGLRKNIMDYPPNERNPVRRAYILKKPCQPKTHDFPQRDISGRLRRFSLNWFKKWDWLEYSVEMDAAFCFVCYLFKRDVEINKGDDAFVVGGFRAWSKPDRLEKHVGGIKSAHNIAYEKYVNLRDAKKTSIEFVFDNASEVQMNEYHIRLNASLTCLRFLLGQGLAFRGHDESEESYSRGNFLELLKWLGGKVEEIGKYTFQNAPKNCQLTSPKIQKDIITCCAKETTKRIIEEVGDGYFSILADESSDVSQKEQLALVLRFVNRENGSVVERFLGILHVGDTTALSLKNAIMSLLMEHSLSPSMIRGQGYEGASNMRGEINGLKTLIMNDTPRAYYIHCFAHQLQLTLVAVAKKNVNCTWLFDVLANLLNVVGASCKRRDLIRKNQAQVVAQALEVGEIESGSGLNQERGLSRPGDTRWGSHYKCLISIINLFPSIVKVLEEIGENGSPDDKLKAQVVLGSLESFDFIFMAHFMLTIFGYTNDLCVALQRKEQDIVNAISLVKSTTNVLQKMRDQGWDSLLDKVILFCTKHEIDVPSMDAQYVPQGRSRRFAKQATNLHHFRVDIFLEVIDLHLQEIDNRFNEKNMELLTCMASLSPRGNFSSFDKERILKLASLYPEEFSCFDLTALDLQLDVFLDSMQNDERFHDLQDINSLSMMLVKTRRHETFPLIHLLIKLMLILPVATASVERVFSAMTFVKNKLRNSMGDQLVNDCLVTYIEKEVFLQVSDEKIIDRFKNMKTRRMNL